MMRTLERALYRGPHLYASVPMIRIMLDLEELEQRPTSTLGDFSRHLTRQLPGLESHGCSVRSVGGFGARLRDGTWMGHVIEHVALELQRLAGSPVSRGKTRSLPGQPGSYNVMYAYRDEASGLLAGRMAIELVRDLLPAELAGVSGLDLIAGGSATGVAGLARLDELTALVRRASFGPTTASIVEEAERRGIPVTRLDGQSLVRLGYGSRQRLIRASITGGTSHLAVTTAGNKDLAKRVLREAGVPVPAGGVVSTADQAVQLARSMRGPFVTKPLNGNHGKGVSLDLTTDDDVRRGFHLAAIARSPVIVEQQLTGRDYRILVIGGKVAAVAERVPAAVTGDGVSTIRSLIGMLNLDERRGTGHENVMTRVIIDASLETVLERAGWSLESVPAAGEAVQLRRTANLSTGGEAIDRSDDIHPDTAAIAERAAMIVGLDIAGIDLLTPDITEPLHGGSGGIVEINAAPGFRMHLAPSHGRPRDVARPVVDLLFPPGSSSLIPITSVTGTNGKSTTVRMIAHILGVTGKRVGMTNTSGIYVDGHLVKSADASGPKSARIVLGDPTVDAAVFETARGGMLREGLAYAKADVGVVLNVSADHLGLKGIVTLNDLAALKSLVVRHVRRRGASVLNADDPLTRRMAKVARGRLCYFSVHGARLPPALEDHVAGGGLLVTIEPDRADTLMVIYDCGQKIPILRVSEIPATHGGAAMVNVENALAAAAAAYAQGISPENIAVGLRTFENTFANNPGRMNITDAPGFTTVVDYAHNPAALRRLGDAVRRLRAPGGRAIGVVSIPGDRRDEDIREMGAIAAGIFDLLIFREAPDGRGRAAGGVLGLLSEGAVSAGMPASALIRIMDEGEAMDAALRMASPDDVVALMPTDVGSVWGQVQNFTRSPERERLANEPGVLHG